MTDDTAWYWYAAGLLAGLAGGWYGGTHVPAAIAGIPFVRALPAVLLASSAIAAVDLVRLALAPRGYERTFVKVGVATAAVLVVYGLAAVVNRIPGRD